MADSILLHINSLLHVEDRPRSFCIVSDNAIAPSALEIKSTPQRAKSAGRHSTGSSRTYSRTRSAPAPTRIPARRRTHKPIRQKSMNDIPLANSRWSSIPDNNNQTIISNKNPRSFSPKQPTRRPGGLSKDSQEQLCSMTPASKINKRSSAPTKPIRKLFDDETASVSSSSFNSVHSLPSYGRPDMSLAHCLVHQKNASTTSKDGQRRNNKKGVRSIRRLPQQSGPELEEKRRNIVDILDAALDSLHMED